MSLLLVTATLQVSAYEVVRTGSPNQYRKWGMSNVGGSAGGVVTSGFLAAGTPGSAYCGIYCEGESSDALPNFYANPICSNATNAVTLVSLPPVIHAAVEAWSSVVDVQFRTWVLTLL